FFFQAADGIRDRNVTGVQTCALPILKTNNINNENDHAKKEILIKELFGSTGEHPFVNPNFRCEFGQNIHVGDNFYANYDCTILRSEERRVGKESRSRRQSEHEEIKSE